MSVAGSFNKVNTEKENIPITLVLYRFLKNLEDHILEKWGGGGLGTPMRIESTNNVKWR